MWFGILFAVIGALLIEKLRTSFSNYQEIAIPIIMSAGIALSAIFISLADGFNQEIVGLLFGSISAVNLSDLNTIIIIAIIVVFFIILFYKELFILSFDEEYSKSHWYSKMDTILIYYYCCNGYLCFNESCRNSAS